MKRFFNIIAVILIFLLVPESPSDGQKPAQVKYKWKNVQMSGGGFVDGIIFHPTEKGLRYCRTDMGGAYRWNNDLKNWEPLLDWLSLEDANLMGVESIALDPSNSDRLYLACGTYTNPNAPNGAVLRSLDRGKTFLRTNVPFKMGANENGRGNGERMAVDPNNGNILYMGTRHAGLWRSIDQGVNWTRVDNFPDISEGDPTKGLQQPGEYYKALMNKGCGIVFVVFDPKSGSKGKNSSTIYVGVSLMGRDNMYCTTDGGQTWKPIPGQPVKYRPTHGVLASDGNMYISYGTNPGPARMVNGGVWKYNTKTGEWTEITPDKPNQDKGLAFGYAAVAVDAHNPKVIITSSFGRYSGDRQDDIFRSTDGGKTWKPVFGSNAKFDYSLAPYIAHTPVHWMFDIEIDPFDSDHAMFTTGYGGHETFNLTDVDKGRHTVWSVMNAGIEETVALELLSPPKGAQLITAIGDYCGFAHDDLDKPVSSGCFENPHFSNTNGVACAENNPDIIVRVGRASHHMPGGHIGYSLDGGKTWQPPVKAPDKESKLGHIAVSSDGSSWIWTPDKSQPYLTKDKGATWTKINLPVDTRIIADKVNPLKFYAISLFEGKFFQSNDGGNTFSEYVLKLSGGFTKNGNYRGDIRGGQDRVYAAPGYENDLWLAAFDGLYRANNTEANFSRLPGVHEIHGFGFGKAAPGKDYPSLYLVGVVNGLRGIFRSDDTAKTWVRINDDQHQWGIILHVTGDPKTYGRVYVGTHGRGTMYGDPE